MTGSTQKRKINQNELNQIIVEHNKWLKNHSEGRQAYLSGISFTDTVLENVNLNHSIIENCDFTFCRFTNTQLRDCTIICSNFNKVNFECCDISEARLIINHFHRVFISNCNISESIFQGGSAERFYPRYNIRFKTEFRNVLVDKDTDSFFKNHHNDIRIFINDSTLKLLYYLAKQNEDDEDEL